MPLCFYEMTPFYAPAHWPDSLFQGDPLEIDQLNQSMRFTGGHSRSKEEQRNPQRRQWLFRSGGNETVQINRSLLTGEIQPFAAPGGSQRVVITGVDETLAQESVKSSGHFAGFGPVQQIMHLQGVAV